MVGSLQLLMKFVILHVQRAVEAAQFLDEEVRHLGQILFRDDGIIDAPGQFLQLDESHCNR